MNQSKTLPLGDRMKEFYENRTRSYLPRRTYTLIRIDGKAFHTYTKGLTKPFDAGLIDDMNETTKYLCENIQGAIVGYVQSDEISVLIQDFSEFHTQMWFDGNVQKMTSISASLATAKFNQLRMARSTWEGNDIDGTLDHDAIQNFKLATFDSRVFQIHEKEEVINYFIWRQRDAIKNSIQSVAQAYFSQKELNKKHTDDMKEMLREWGVAWEDFTYREKCGGIVSKVAEIYTRQKGTKGKGEPYLYDINMMEPPHGYETYVRNTWKMTNTPVISEDRDYLSDLIPSNGR